MGCLFTLLVLYDPEQKFLILTEFNMSVFSLIVSAFISVVFMNLWGVSWAALGRLEVAACLSGHHQFNPKMLREHP